MDSSRVTITDVARAAGTSTTSASVALRGTPGVSDETRAHIAAVAARLGYRPNIAARRLRQERSRLLGVTFALDQSFHSDLVTHLYGAVDAITYDLVLSAETAHRPAVRAAESLLQDRVEALLLISPEITDVELATIASRAERVVAIGSEVTVPGVYSVRTDDRAGIGSVVDHLVELGHTDIAYAEAASVPLNAERRTAYMEAMRSHGLDEHVRVLSASNTEAAGAELAARLLIDPRLPTALIAYNDMLAIGLLLALKDGGVVVPQDVSIVGYDDTQSAGWSSVDLTSVRQDGAQLARIAVEWATEPGERDLGNERTELVAPQLIVRSTTALPRAVDT
ncbi:LacI family transcriptional regulator [Rhodococcoides trifolii]|uniref:LacI family transcriptional regulator n=1 Tax=Rhodococcoides trifolii TaxID=908250 RepID=A0A917G7G5_9NOCA|nr:LacI family DNA-binding transcriptional regulator [Rhodococcus trifolii]GGG26408.1 LacI family transcriptional regulator [Rhodococcus trifolii]